MAPADIRPALMALRQLIIETAQEMEITDLQETLKWGEPAWLTKGGSTLRIGWKPATPGQYALYFHCKTRLIATIREIYGDLFDYDGNRAILFNLGEAIPVAEVRHCISLSLSYHSIKHLPMLGGCPT